MGQALQLYGSPMFYFAVIVLAAVTMLPVLIVKVWVVHCFLIPGEYWFHNFRFKFDLRLDLQKYVSLPKDVQGKIHDIAPRGWCPCLWKVSWLFHACIDCIISLFLSEFPVGICVVVVNFYCSFTQLWAILMIFITQFITGKAIIFCYVLLLCAILQEIFDNCLILRLEFWTFRF